MANRGIVTMKTQAGGYSQGATDGVSPQQAALKWVLDKDFVDCAIPGMVGSWNSREMSGAVKKWGGVTGRPSMPTITL